MKKYLFILLAAGLGIFKAGAWDYEGHRAVNELALASLPADFGIQLTPALKGRIAVSRGRAGSLAECHGFAAETFQRAGSLH